MDSPIALAFVAALVAMGCTGKEGGPPVPGMESDGAGSGAPYGNAGTAAAGDGASAASADAGALAADARAAAADASVADGHVADANVADASFADTGVANVGGGRCSDGAMRWSGSVGGEPVELALTSADFETVRVPGEGRVLTVGSGELHELMLKSPGFDADDVSSLAWLPPGKAYAVTGVVLLPAEEASPQRAACIRWGSVMLVGEGSAEFTLEVTAPMACPGQAVAGSLSLTGCGVGGQRCEVSGTIDGIALDPEIQYGRVWNAGGWSSQSGGVVRFLFDDFNSRSGGILGGFIVMPEMSAHSGAVYCIGGGAFRDGEEEVHLENVGRLGACGDSAGPTTMLSGCFQAAAP